MLLLIDNYDSFTYNLSQYFQELGQSVKVVLNNAVTVDEVVTLNPDFLVISPGPGTPEDAGISLKLIHHFAGKLPILGVCLGHQCIAQVFGGRVCPASKPMHGKTSWVYHRGETLFRGIQNPMQATRYHSLIVDKNIPDCLKTIAWTQNASNELDEIMAIAHTQWPIWGVQFHPESILTLQGKQLLENFLIL